MSKPPIKKFFAADFHVVVALSGASRNSYSVAGFWRPDVAELVR